MGFSWQTEVNRERKVFAPSAIDPRGAPGGEKSVKGHRDTINRPFTGQAVFLWTGREGGAKAKNDAEGCRGVRHLFLTFSTF